MLFYLAINLANATAINQQPGRQTEDYELTVHEITTPVIESPAQVDLFQIALPESTLWIKNALGEDFNHYFTQKIINKKIKADALKMDFRLVSSYQKITKTDQSNKAFVETNKTQSQPLDVTDIQFSDESYVWNPANLTMVKLGSDYQRFVNDEVSAGKTYKEFWDGEETTALEDFVDEHFGLHESALVRYLIFLAGILIVIFCFMLKPKVIQFLYPD